MTKSSLTTPIIIIICLVLSCAVYWAAQGTWVRLLGGGTVQDGIKGLIEI